MKRNYKNITNKFIIILTIFTCAIFFTRYGKIKANAYELYSESSTNNYYQGYDGCEGEPSDNWHNNDLEVSYHPMITVLTPGLGSRAAIWSNDFGYTTNSKLKLSYDPDSLIERLRVEANGANVFWAEMIENQFFLMPLEEKEPFSNYNSNELPKISVLTPEDISQHIVLVFDPDNNLESNDVVYQKFKLMMNRIVRDIAYLTGGVYPKINLIGHSRGGIINLMYAMDYYKIVGNIFSLGTPYFGSNCGKINAFVDAMRLYGNDGFNDVQNNNPVDGGSTTLYNKWNSNYEAKYSHISVYAIAGNSNLSFYDDLANEGYLTGYGTMVEDLLLGLHAYRLSLMDPVTHVIVTTKIINEIHDYEDANGLPNTPNFDIIEVLDSLAFGLTMSNDLFVSVNSQLGLKAVTDSYIDFYKGFQSYTRFFKIDDENIDLNKRSNNQAPAVHNLEARDSQIINYILDNIDFADGLFDTVDLENNEIKIVGVKYNIRGQLHIPSQINGRTVTIIDEYALSNETLLTFISLPNSVQSIGNFAFANCSGLEAITIPDNVVSIGHGAFLDCNSLSNLTIPFVGSSLSEDTDTYFGYIFGAVNNSNQNSYIPSSLKTVTITGGTIIASNAFNGCNKLENIYIPASVINIGTNVFSGCTNLNKIVVASDNPVYNSIYNSNAIIETATHELLYGCNNTYIPTTVTSIAPYAFQNCINLTSANLAYIKVIGDYAFLNCKSLTNIVIDRDTESIGFGAFLGCTNLESIIIPFVGNSLENPTVSHFGYIFGAASSNTNNSYVPASLKNVSITVSDTIVDYAFANCSSITNITLWAPFTNIGEKAFQNCTSLTGFNNIDSYSNLLVNAFELNENSNTTILEISKSSIANHLESITIQQLGKYEINIAANIKGINTLFILYKEVKMTNNQTYFEILNIELLTSGTIEKVLMLAEGVYYLGYLNSNSLDTIGITIKRQISQYGSQYILTDVHEVGSEVQLNGGNVNGNTITQGYTRLLFFQNTSEIPSISRLQYTWYSSDPSVATISAYGTVHALSVNEDTVIKIMAVYNYDYSKVFVKEFVIKKETMVSTGDLIEIAVFMNVPAGSLTYIDLSTVVVPINVLQYYTWSSDTNVSVDSYGRILASLAGKGGTYISLGIYKYNPRIYIYIYITIT